jgi:O-methyltransferase
MTSGTDRKPCAPLTPPLWEEALLRLLAKPSKRPRFIDFVMRRLLPRDHHAVFWGDRMLTLDKATGFLDDPAFVGPWNQVCGAHEYDQYDNRQSIAWRIHTLVWAAREALRAPEGDFVECGVFQGDMSYVVYHAAGLAGAGRRLHLYDSFQGIHPDRLVEGEYRRSPDYLTMANAHYRRPDLYSSVVARFAPYPEVSVHKGFLPESLGTAPASIAWLHIDLNSARAEAETLEVLFDRVVPGGFVILDDYGWLVLDAQKQAADAFFAPRGYAVLELPTGQGLVVKRA